MVKFFFKEFKQLKKIKKIIRPVSLKFQNMQTTLIGTVYFSLLSKGLALAFSVMPFSLAFDVFSINA